MPNDYLDAKEESIVQEMYIDDLKQDKRNMFQTYEKLMLMLCKKLGLEYELASEVDVFNAVADKLEERSYLRGWNAAIQGVMGLLNIHNSFDNIYATNLLKTYVEKLTPQTEDQVAESVKEFREDNQPDEAKADIQTALAHLSAYIEGGDELGDVSEQDAIAALKLITRKLESK